MTAEHAAPAVTRRVRETKADLLESFEYRLEDEREFYQAEIYRLDTLTAFERALVVAAMKYYDDEAEELEFVRACSRVAAARAAP